MGRPAPVTGHVVAPLLRALMSIPRRPESRLILVPLRETRPPFYDLRDDYNVMLRGRKVGRIRFNHKTYPHEAHVPWRWFLNDMGATAWRTVCAQAARKR